MSGSRLSPLAPKVLRCEYSNRQTVNLKKGVMLERCFITAKFRKRPDGQADPLSPPEAETDERAGVADPAPPPEDLPRAPPRPPVPPHVALPEEADRGCAAQEAAGATEDEAAELDGHAWSEAKRAVQQCLDEALGLRGASAALRCRLLDEGRHELASGVRR